MTHLFRRFFHFTTTSPLVVILLVCLVTAAAALGFYAPNLLDEVLREPRESPDSRQGQLASKPKPQTEVVVDPLSVTDADAIMVIRSKSLFSQSGAAALQEMDDALRELPYVESVLWMENVPPLNLFGLQEPLFPSSTASPRQFANSRQKALNNPLIGGQLLSLDAETTLFMIHFDWLFVESDEDCRDNLKKAVLAISDKYDDIDFEIYITGKVPGYLTFVETQRSNRYLFQAIGYCSIFVMALILFRGIRAVLIVSIAPILGVFWTVGLINFFDFRDNPFNDVILPVLLSLIGLTDGVHLLVEIRKRRAAGASVENAAIEGLQNVGFACALTSITTAIGFGTLSLAHNDIVAEFGMCCVLGVILTFFAVVLVIPLISSSSFGRNIHHGYGQGLVDQNLQKIGSLIDAVLRRPKVYGIMAIITTVFFSLIALTLRPDERRTDSLPQNSEYIVATRLMDKELLGLEIARVEIHWDDSLSADSERLLSAIEAVDNLLDAEELIGGPLSINRLLKALPSDSPVEERMSLADLLPEELRREYLQPERNRAKITFRVQDLGIAAYGPVFERLKLGLREIEQQHPGLSLELDGSAVWRYENLYQIVVDLASSLGTAILAIFVVLSFAFGSIRIGLISIVPNLFPLAVTGTYLALTGKALEIASVCAFTVCLGIAVDDTIHFIARYKDEHSAPSTIGRIRTAVFETGTALILTTIVLLVGFSTVLLSDMRDQRIFAMMGVLTISSALFADLVFLPALLALGESRDENKFTRREPSSIANPTPTDSSPTT